MKHIIICIMVMIPQFFVIALAENSNEATINRQNIVSGSRLIEFTKNIDKETLEKNYTKRAIDRLSKLNHKKLRKLMAEVGKEVPENFYDCLCKEGRGGAAMGVNVLYHPAAYGTGSTFASCPKPNLSNPCVAAGFGCWRFPLPMDSKTLMACMQSSKYDDNTTIVDAIVNALLDKSPKVLNKDELAKLQKELDACKKRYFVYRKIDDLMKDFEGLEYLKNNGYPLLEVPSSIKIGIKKDINEANSVISKELREKEKKLKSKIEKQWNKDVIGKEVGINIAKNPKTYILGVKAAKVALEYDMQVKQKRLTDLEQEIKAAIGSQKNSQAGAANQHKEELKRERENIDAQINQAKRDQSHLNSLIQAIDVSADVLKAGEIFNNISSKDKKKNAKAILESTVMVQKYFKKYQDNVVNLSDFKQFTKDKMNDSDFNKLIDKSNNLNAVSDVLGTAVTAAKYGMDIHAKYIEYQRIKSEAIQMYNSGRYDDAQANMLTAFEAMSYLTDKAADYMPPGMNDMVKFYAEAMKTPAKFDKIMRDIVNKNDSMANITGDQVWKKAMKKYEEEHGDIADRESLDRDNYLYKKAGLSVYKMNNSEDPKPYVVIARSDKAPIYVDEKTFRRLKEMAFYYPIVYKERLTDPDLYQHLSNIGRKGTINIQGMVDAAKKIMKKAAADKRIADMYGKKTITLDELSQWQEFNKIMYTSLPKACALDKKRQKNLFNSYLQGTEKVGFIDESLYKSRIKSGRESVVNYLKEYGAKLKMAEDKVGK